MVVFTGTIYNLLLHDYHIDVNFDATNIEISKEGSAMKILNRAKKSKKYSEFFEKEMVKLMISSNVFYMDYIGLLIFD